MQKCLNVEENITNGYESARPAPRACPTELSKEMKHKSKGEITPTIIHDTDLQVWFKKPQMKKQFEKLTCVLGTSVFWGYWCLTVENVAEFLVTYISTTFVQSKNWIVFPFLLTILGLA